jgi:hypothetical protein
MSSVVSTLHYNEFTFGPTAQATLVYIKKYLKPKEELWKLKYFTMQKYNIQKILWKKKTEILQDIITL